MQAGAIQAISDDDVTACADLSLKVGWPHRMADWRLMLRLGSGLIVRDRGLAIGVALWWPFGTNFATFGMIIVDPDHQGQGLGSRLMAALIAETGDRSITLHATEAGKKLYSRFGFREVGIVSKHEGMTASPSTGPLDCSTVRQAERDDLQAIFRLDRAASGLDRKRLLEELLLCGEANILADARGSTGFSFIRPFGRGSLIGPVVANTADDARRLIQHWIAQRAGQYLRIDTPVAGGLSEWLSDHGLAFSNSVTVMVRGHFPAGERNRLFALASQALG